MKPAATNPLIDHVLSWTTSQLPDPLARAPLDQDRADAALMAKVMRGPDGPALLELFARSTVLRPPTRPDLTGPASHDYCQRRTGENAVFGVIVHLLNLHDELQRTETDDRRPERTPPVFGWSDRPGLAAAAWAGGQGPGDPDAGDAGGGEAFDAAGTIAAG